MKSDDTHVTVPLDDADLQSMVRAARDDGPSREAMDKFALRVAPLVGVGAAALGASSAATGAAAATASASSAASAAGASASGATAAKIAAAGTATGLAAKFAGMSVIAKLVVAGIAVTTVGVAGTAVYRQATDARRASVSGAVETTAQSSGEASSPEASSPEASSPEASSVHGHELAIPVNPGLVAPVVDPVATGDEATVGEGANAGSSIPARANVRGPRTTIEPAAPQALEGAPAPSEVELLTEAQRRVATDPRSALGFVEQHERLYPQGVHAQEREVLAIQALMHLHRTSDAQRRASRFDQHFPSSTHRHRIEVLLSGSTSAEK
ncbi:MAG: hypothetical protein IPK60_18340 [Sandaracinaceae bacterium]|nr:hypothetical protein [Sandaracinaceae bacterium]